MHHAAVPSLKETLKERAPGFRLAWRKLSRLRWLAKLGVVRYSKSRVLDRHSLRYILWDPEVESHTYEATNVEELAQFCAHSFGFDLEDARRWIEETRTEPELTTRLRERTKRRFDYKTQPPIAQRLLWWVVVRGLRPRFVVETGVYDGLGTIVLLAALERNAQEGGPDARLVGIDSDPNAGWLVPENLTHRWEKVVGMTTDVLEEAIAGREVDLFLHDTPHIEAVQEHEFGTALAHAAPRLVIIDGGGGQTPTLARLASGHGSEERIWVPVADGHPYRPTGVGIAVFERDAAAG